MEIKVYFCRRRKNVIKKVEIITSTQNPKVKHVLTLQQKSAERRKSGLFVVEGRRELMHCIEAGFTVETVYVCPTVCVGTEPMPSLPLGVRMFEVSSEVYDKMAYRGSTEGVVAVVRARKLTLEELIKDDSQSTTHNSNPTPQTSNLNPHPPLLVVVEHVEKPGNLGAVLRSADAAGADGVVVCDPLTDLYNPNLIRASVGAIFSVPCVACSSEECIEFLKRKGIQILTAQLQDSSLYYDTDMQRPTAIVMGTEATGLTPQWREAADAHIRIPMLGRVDSLNVSVSAAILLFEAVRQRMDKR